MGLFIFSIRLTKPVLGALRDTKTGHMGFVRAKGNKDAAVLDPRTWQWLWSAAFDMIDPDLSPYGGSPPSIYRDAIRMEGQMVLPTLMLYPRKTQSNKEVRHESIPAGTILTLSAAVVSPEPRGSAASNLRKPRLDEVTQALQYMGQMLGISPWGKQFGYGRFNLHEIRVYDGRELHVPAAGRELRNGGASDARPGEAADLQREGDGENTREEGPDDEDLQSRDVHTAHAGGESAHQSSVGASGDVEENSRPPSGNESDNTLLGRPPKVPGA